MQRNACNCGCGRPQSVLPMVLRDRRAKMRSPDGQMKRVGIASLGQPRQGFPFNPALRFVGQATRTYHPQADLRRFRHSQVRILAPQPASAVSAV